MGPMVHTMKNIVQMLSILILNQTDGTNLSPEEIFQRVGGVIHHVSNRKLTYLVVNLSNNLL